jgi:uncharacterized protein (TIRG00374 family)
LLDRIAAVRHNGHFQSAWEGLGVKNKWWKTVLQYGAGFTLLAYVLWSNWDGLKDVFRPDRDKRWGCLALAALVASISVSLTFVRWYFLVRAQDLPFTLRDAFRLGLVGYFFNTFLPGAVGGDLLKAAFIAREHERRTVAVSTVLIDRGVGLWGLIALVATAGTAFWLFDDSILRDQKDLMRAVQFAIGLMAATFALWAFLGVLPERRAQRFAQRLNWIPKIGSILAEFWRAVWLYRRRSLAIFGALFLSMCNHSLLVLVFYLSALTFQPEGGGQAPPLSAHFILVPAGLAFQGFFPSPGGVGGGELIFSLLYERLGYPPQNAIWASLGQRSIAWTLGICGYIVYLFMKRAVPKPIAPEST